MVFFKKFSLVLLWLLFTNLLLVLAFIWSVNETFGNKESVKNWLSDSGTYDTLVDTVVTEFSKGIELNDAGAQSTPDSAALTNAANEAFTPQSLRSTVEQVVDGAYNWLDGSSSSLNFSIDLRSQKDTFINGLASAAESRLASLPECSSVQLQTLDASDPFSLECRPPGDTSQFVADFKSQLATSSDFFPDTVLNAGDVKIENASGVEETIDQALPGAPEWYQQAQASQWIVLVLTLLSAVGMVFLSERKRYGLRHIANGLIMCAVLLAVVGVITANISDLIPEGDGSTQATLLKPLADEIGDNFGAWQYRFAVIYLVLAVVLYIAVYILKRRTKTQLATEDTHPFDVRNNEQKPISTPAAMNQEKTKPNPEVSEKSTDHQTLSE